jgi:hypothetical protein
VPVSDFFWGGFTQRWRRNSACPPTPIPIITTTSTGSSRCRTWTRGSARSRPEGNPRGSRGEDRLRRHHAQAFRVSHAGNARLGDRHVRKTGAGGVRRPARPAAFFRGATTRSPAWATASSANSPPWIETVKSLWPDFPGLRQHDRSQRMPHAAHRPAKRDAVDGRGARAHGRGHQPHRRLLPRDGRAEIAAGAGLLDGFVIWGDVAYKKCTFMSPNYWREYFKPWVAKITARAHANGLPVIYHGCGNVKAIFQDYIDMGIDAYNPLEVKAGMDASTCAAIRPWHRLLRQQRHPGLGIRRPRGHPARGPAQTQRGQGRRLHLPVRPFGEQRRLRPAPTTTS